MADSSRVDNYIASEIGADKVRDGQCVKGDSHDDGKLISRSRVKVYLDGTPEGEELKAAAFGNNKDQLCKAIKKRARQLTNEKGTVVKKAKAVDSSSEMSKMIEFFKAEREAAAAERERVDRERAAERKEERDAIEKQRADEREDNMKLMAKLVQCKYSAAIQPTYNCFALQLCPRKSRRSPLLSRSLRRSQSLLLRIRIRWMNWIRRMNWRRN